MKTRKEKQYIIFEREDGKECRYDLSNGTVIGFRGKEVQSLQSQLKGMTIAQILDSFEEGVAKKFFKHVANRITYNTSIVSFSTVLARAGKYSPHEQYISAGLTLGRYTGYSDTECFEPISSFPKGMIALFRKYEVPMLNVNVKSYIENPNLWNETFRLMENEEIIFGTKEIIGLLTKKISVRIRDHRSFTGHTWTTKPFLNCMNEEYGYDKLSLIKYINKLITYEACNGHSIMGELQDYASMMKEISEKFDKYPQHFLTTHAIASRTYNRLKIDFDEKEFSKTIDLELECEHDKYAFIAPKTTKDIKDEAVQQNNCVSSYIDRVIEGASLIMFMRNKNNKEDSLVTLEIKDYKVVQAKRRFNYEVTATQKESIRWFENRLQKIKEKRKLDLTT